MPPISPLLDCQADFDPAGDFDEFLKRSPARWVVYLFVDADERPVQLLCVKNLRYSLKRRLGGSETIGLSRRVNYRDLVRRVYWRRVDSAFEADWLYFEVAREVFPQTYRGMVGFRPAWFVHVNPETSFPRYVKTIDLSRSGVLAGPLEDKHAAAWLIQTIEDAFDLCRYYQILVEAPNGRACAYKEMGKCPAPCDGSISMEQYRRMIAWSVEVMLNPEPEAKLQQRRMKQAAAELLFEEAAAIKAFSDQLTSLGHGPNRHVRRLQQFSFLTVQPGPRQGTAKIFLILPGQVAEIFGLIGDGVADAAWVLREALARADAYEAHPLNQEESDRLSIVTHHLFAPKQQSAAFLRLSDVDERSFSKLARSMLQKQSSSDGSEAAEDEGVIRELQSITQEMHRGELA